MFCRVLLEKGEELIHFYFYYHGAHLCHEHVNLNQKSKKRLCLRSTLEKFPLKDSFQTVSGLHSCSAYQASIHPVTDTFIHYHAGCLLFIRSTNHSPTHAPMEQHWEQFRLQHLAQGHLWTCRPGVDSPTFQSLHHHFTTAATAALLPAVCVFKSVKGPIFNPNHDVYLALTTYFCCTNSSASPSNLVSEFNQKKTQTSVTKVKAQHLAHSATLQTVQAFKFSHVQVVK